MAYSLIFSQEFFLAEGEPCDRSDLALNADGKPVSVWSAISQLREDSPKVWAELAKDIFQCEPQALTEETVLEKIEETNTCSNLSIPVEVWIDSVGDYTVEVWE